MSNYYTPSGKVSPMAYVYFLLATIIIFPILALIYAYAIWYIPFPYINFFIAAGFGLGIGATVNFLVVKYGKVRSYGIALLFGLIGALFAMYFHWAIWVDLVMNIGETYGTDRIGIATSNIKMGQVFTLVTNPGPLFGIIGEINNVGTWGLKGSVVSGTPLTVIWVIEALIILFVAVTTSSTMTSQQFAKSIKNGLRILNCQRLPWWTTGPWSWQV